MPSLALPPPCQPLLCALRQRHGIDFAHYLPGSLLRRISLRMEHVGIADYAAYASYLAAAADECDQLLSTILVNHSAFFRDTDVWSAVASALAPQLAERGTAATPLRVWSAGCASGQEPYSAAMLLAELLGLERVASGVTIYATDVDTDALEQVHQGRYHPWQVRMVPPDLLQRYFVHDGAQYLVRDELRRAVVVKRHNLLTDAPPARIDLLLCRNVLIYLNTAAQREVVKRLGDALADEGLLVLGKTELTLAAPRRLRWVSRRLRIAARADSPR